METDVIGYVVKKPGHTARAFLIEKHLGTDASPEEAARAEALEYFFEGYPKGEAPIPTYAEGRRVTVIE